MSIKFSEFTAVTDFTDLVGLSAADNGKITKENLKLALGVITQTQSDHINQTLIDVAAVTVKANINLSLIQMLSADNTGDGQLLNVTTAERDAISNPNPGLMIFNTTTNVTNFYNGTNWV